VTYQWRFKGANIGGATTDSLLLTNVTAAGEGNYSAVIANSSGSVTSAPAMLYWDSVGDGIPDSWKIQYFGSVTNVTASADPLLVGVANLDKFLEGTNPTNGIGLLPRLIVSGLNGYTSVSPDQDKFTLGQTVQLTAVPHPGFQFVGWSGDLTGTNNPATSIMDRTKRVAAVFSLPLQYTLDATNMTWRSGGDVPWFGQDYVSYDGVAAAQNGPIRPEQVSWLEATVYLSGEGAITFWWKRVASAGSRLTLTINGVQPIQQISGSDWSQIIYYLPAGTSVIRWTYEKTYEPPDGFDAVWVDQVVAAPYSDPFFDSDFDGLADLWEYNNNGDLNLLGTGDQDNDGVNNHDEYLDGSDPFDPNSVFPRLNIASSGGTVTRSPSLAQYAYLQPVTLTAVPNVGFSFIGWSDDLAGPTNPASLTMDRNKTVSAWFASTVPNALAAALDAPNLVWSTGGDAPWFAETLETHDGVDAARSGLLRANQESWIETTVNGPGPLSFWWEVKASFAQLQFLTNGVQRTRISGDSGWQQVSLNLPSGPNVLRWNLVKGTFAGPLDDAGSVDQVVFGTSAPSIISTPLNRTVLQGSNTAFTVKAVSGLPLSYRWQKNGVDLTDGGDISGATTTNLNLSNVQTTDSGTYTVLVATSSGTVSSAASLTVVAVVALAQALDTPSWTWSSGSSATNSSWLGQTLTCHDGTDAAQIANLTGFQNASLGTTLNGPGVLQFWWKVSCVNHVSRFDFVLNGATLATIWDEVDWMPRSFLIPPGSSTALWLYSQGASSRPQAAWLDQVAFIPGLPPSITAQPISQAVPGGANVTFTVTASGTGPLSYQWFFNRTNRIGSNSSTLTLTGVQFAASGNYSVQITNVLGKVTSTNADLIVNVPPFIITQPTNTTVLVGSVVTLSVTASGTAPLSYQWQKEGTALVGATQPSLVLTNVQASQSGSYSVLVKNAFGSVPSSVAHLVAGVPPTISTQPSNQTASAGATVTLSVVASGTAPLYYQWLKDSVILPGQSAPDLILANFQFSDVGSYSVIVSNVLGSVESDFARVDMGFVFSPYILVQPLSQTVPPGGSAVFTVSADGQPPLFYQWRKNGTNLAGATDSFLQLANVQVVNAGRYDVVITNFSGSVTSEVAVLTVGGSTNLTLSPNISNGVFRLGWAAVIGRSYQVQYLSDLRVPLWSNLVPVITATNSQAVVTDVIGNSPRRFYRVGILPPSNEPPIITSQPIDQTVAAGSSVTFSVTATGSAPLAYQWRKNFTDLVGETASTLQLTNVQFDDIGLYDVVVSNDAGSVTSDPAILFVQ
jgi:hypothetical protein